MAKDIPQHKTTTHAHKVTPKPKRTHKPRERRTSSSSRGYNARWERFRASFLKANPLCEYCLARGQVTPATVCDHDLPHEGDRDLFWDNTFTALCAHDHNSTKQRMERTYKGDALLKAIACAKDGTRDFANKRARVDKVQSSGATLVWGPPAAGKTTWARAEAIRTGAIVYDLDDISEGMGMPRYGRSKAQASMALDEMFDRLGKHPRDCRLILINSGPTAAKRKFWSDLIGAQAVISVIEPMITCIARVSADPDRLKHKEEQCRIISDWFSEAEYCTGAV